MLKAKILATATMLLLTVSSAIAAVSPNILIGKWRGTGDVNNCPETELIVTHNAFTAMQNGVAYHSTVLGIDAQSDGKSVNITRMPGGVDPYTVIDNNHILLQTPFTQCPYTRE